MTELVFSIVMLIMCVVLFLIAGTFPSSPIAQGGGAAFYPRFLLAVLFFLMILYIIENRKKIMQALKRKDGEGFRAWFAKSRYLLAFAVVLILIPVSFNTLGFIITGIWSIFASSMVLRWKDKKLSVKGTLFSLLLAVAMSIIIYVVFVKVFVIPLPKGKIF